MNDVGADKEEALLPRGEAARALDAVEQAAHKVGRAAETIETCTQKVAAGLSVRDVYQTGLLDGVVVSSVFWMGAIILWAIFGRAWHRT